MAPRPVSHTRSQSIELVMGAGKLVLSMVDVQGASINNVKS
jgi:hypothetical protein